jgi:hypothetical protein
MPAASPGGVLPPTGLRRRSLASEGIRIRLSETLNLQWLSQNWPFGFGGGCQPSVAPKSLQGARCLQLSTPEF